MKQKAILFDADKQRFLKMGIRAMVNLEEATGKTMQELGKDMGEKPSMKMMVIMFHALLSDDDKDLTLEGTYDVIEAAMDKHGFAYIGEKMAEAMEAMSGENTPTVQG